MKVRYERGALADLDEIFAYIARDNRQAAARLVGRIEQVVRQIGETPYLGEARGTLDFGDFP
ncbi:MAG TPA: type II toxin-antitoxin system RelE/ParE family toxin [Xanthobacteraceae bacterium]|jgi:toxin ParE1/3/4